MLPAESLMRSRRLMSVLHYYYYEMHLCNLNTDLAFMFRIKSMQRHLQMTCTSTDTINKIRWFKNLCAVSERPRRCLGRVIKIRRSSMKRFGFGRILFGLLLLIFRFSSLLWTNTMLWGVLSLFCFTARCPRIVTHNLKFHVCDRVLSRLYK